MILISEILPNPQGNDRNAEWVELENDGSAAVALGGWALKDASGKVIALWGEVPSGGRLLFRGGGLSLNNAEETLMLLDPAGIVRDSVSWAAAPEGESFARDGSAFAWTRTPTPGEANRVLSAMFEKRLLLAHKGAPTGADGMGTALGLSVLVGLAAALLAQYLFRHLNAASDSVHAS